MSIIASIATANPAYKHKQNDILTYMTTRLRSSHDERRLLSLLYERSGINYRYSVLSEFSDRYSSLDEPFFEDIEDEQSIDKRMAYYRQHAGVLGQQAAEKCLKDFVQPGEITHLITVSCTGLSAPGLDLELIERLGLSATINRSCVNFMGCYATFHAFKQADLICKADLNANVLIVSVELCTIHFQSKNDIDNLTANLLFADGAAAALICSDELAKKKARKGFRIDGYHSEIHGQGKKDMSWQVSSTGFLMTLSKDVPDLIAAEIKRLVSQTLLGSKETVDSIVHWAIHPGGKRILSAIQKELGLEKEALQSPYRVLENYGNMSSATILFVLKDIWDSSTDWEKEEPIFAAGFGPGLTMETMLLRSQNSQEQKPSKKAKASVLQEH